MLRAVDFSVEDMEKGEYKVRREELTERLVVLQQRAREAGVGLVVLFEGWDGAGKGSRISDLMYHLDARSASVYVPADVDQADVRAFSRRGHGVSGYFPMWQQYWKALGERGAITFYDRGWYTTAIQYMMAREQDGLLAPEDEARFVESIRDFERQLVTDGYVVVKFFLHVRKKALKKRLMNLFDDPATRWRATDSKLESIKEYDQRLEYYEELLESSNFGFAPWTVLNAEDKRRTNVEIAQTLVDALEQALEQRPKTLENQASRAQSQSESMAQEVASLAKRAFEGTSSSQELGFVTLEAWEKAYGQRIFAPESTRFPIVEDYPRIDRVDHGLSLSEEQYRARLKDLQKRLFRLENLMYQARIPLMIMYEGWDAAGKGGNIKRVAQALDARAYTIFLSPAPTKVELAHPHLWRYWTRLPKAGHVGFYDRSWYGRVLVERVEGFATPEQWARGYDEINEFEQDLVEWGAILLKFWVDVSPDAQLRRFEDRAADLAKQWKITPDDWRNREKYPQYKLAIDDMFRLTSTTFAPWVVLESDDKKYARIKALEHIVAALEQRLG